MFVCKLISLFVLLSIYLAAGDIAEIDRERFSNGLAKWHCKKVYFVNNTENECSLLLEKSDKVTVAARSFCDFSRGGGVYTSISLIKDAEKTDNRVFHIDQNSPEHCGYTITLDRYRSPEEIAGIQERNSDFKELFASKKLWRFKFENKTCQMCVIRLNEGCEYIIEARGVYDFPVKSSPHHSLELIDGTGRFDFEGNSVVLLSGISFSACPRVGRMEELIGGVNDSRFKVHNNFVVCSQRKPRVEKYHPGLYEHSLTTIKDGMLYQRGEVLSCEPTVWAMNQNGELCVFPTKRTDIFSDEPKHTHFFQKDDVGLPVACAGIIKIKNGKIVSIDRNSGHYHPAELQLILVIHFLHNQGVLANKVKFVSSYKRKYSCNCGSLDEILAVARTVKYS